MSVFHTLECEIIIQQQILLHKVSTGGEKTEAVRDFCSVKRGLDALHISLPVQRNVHLCAYLMLLCLLYAGCWMQETTWRTTTY